MMLLKFNFMKVLVRNLLPFLTKIEKKSFAKWSLSEKYSCGNSEQRFTWNVAHVMSEQTSKCTFNISRYFSKSQNADWNTTINCCFGSFSESFSIKSFTRWAPNLSAASTLIHVSIFGTTEAFQQFSSLNIRLWCSHCYVNICKSVSKLKSERGNVSASLLWKKRKLWSIKMQFF